MRASRGLRYSVTRLIAPPLPAASRPSKITTILAPSARTHSCIFTSSPCRRNSSASYRCLGSLCESPSRRAAFLPLSLTLPDIPAFSLVRALSPACPGNPAIA